MESGPGLRYTCVCEAMSAENSWSFQNRDSTLRFVKSYPKFDTVQDSSHGQFGQWQRKRPGKRTIDYVYERYSEVLEKRLAKLNEEV